MEDIVVKVPRDLSRILKVTDDEVPKLVRLYLAIELYRESLNDDLKTAEKIL